MGQVPGVDVDLTDTPVNCWVGHLLAGLDGSNVGNNIREEGLGRWWW